MATKDIEFELPEVHIDMPAANPGPSGRTQEVATREPGKEANVPKDPNEGSQEVSPEIVVQDDENTAGEHVTLAADLSGRTPEDVLKDIINAILGRDVGAFNQHLAELERLLQDNSTVRERLTASGALCYAAYRGSTPMMDALIEKGVGINSKSPFFGSESAPLHVAAEYSFVDTVRHLIVKGADVNIKDGNGNTPLHLAAMEGECKKVRFVVVDGGATVAAMEGKSDKVRCLVDSGAHVNITNHCGKTPLYLASESCCRIDTVKFLVAHGAEDWEDVLGNLEKAIQGGDVETFNSCLVLFERFYQDEDSTASEQTLRGALTASGALCYAAWVGSTPMMDTLIEKGVDVNTKTSKEIKIDGMRQKWIPLHVAARSGRVDTMIHLIEKGADVSIKMDNRWTPLHAAASGGKVNTVRYLVEKGANVNSKDRHGRTPLHLAAEHGSVDSVRYIIDEGADVNTKDYWGNTPLYRAAAHASADAVSYLVDKGADVNSKNDLGRTPLHWAAERGNVDAVSYLVDKGADVNSKARYGRTPIHLACEHGNAETVKYLLEKGADPTAKDTDGWNSLTRAIDSRSKDSAALLLGCKDHKWCEEMLRCPLWDTTHMRRLIADMPDVAEIALSRCVITNEGGKDLNREEVHATTETFEVRYNYEFIEDFKDRHSSDSSDESSNSEESWRPEKFTKENHPLNLMMKHGCSNLLKHPLVISLLEHKWNNFGRYIFFGNLFLYLIFLAFLTAFGLVVLSPAETTCIDVFNGSFNGTAPGDCKDLSIHEYRFLYVGAAVTILTALLRLALEIFQLCTHPLEYLLDWVNWLEIPLYLFSVIFTFVFSTPCLCVYSWQWQIGVVAVFLGWVGLITFLQKLPATGVYVLMFVNMLGSFMKIAFLALLLVIAFTIAFYMLLFDPKEMRTPFSHPGRAVVKVMAMTTGEIDFDELYRQHEGEDEIAFPVLSFLFWIIFLVLMPVLLSNLLVGLAVGDVDRLQKAASENRIKLQIDLVLSFEELLESLGIRYWFAIKPKTHYPNVPVTLLPQWCKKRGVDDDRLADDPDHYDPGRLGKVRRWIAKVYSKLWISDEYSTSGVKISDAIKPPPEPLEKQLQTQRQHLQAQLQKQSEQIDTKLQKQSKQFETKLNEQLEVKVKEQNEHQSDKLEAKLKEQFSEYHKEQAKQSDKQAKKMEEQAKKMEEQAKQQAMRMEEQAKQSDEQAKKMEEQAKKMEEQAKQQAMRMEEQAKQSDEQAKKMEEQAKKMEEQAKQQAMRMEEQAKQSDEQAKKMEEQAKKMEEQAKQQAMRMEEQAKKMEEQAKKAEEKTEHLAGEVASLREALEKLVAQMTVK